MIDREEAAKKLKAEQTRQVLQEEFEVMAELPQSSGDLYGSNATECDQKSYAQTVLLCYFIKTNRSVPVSFPEKPCQIGRVFRLLLFLLVIATIFALVGVINGY
ncbi:hypothetical protein [Marinithermofilum abyssi]|uniref:hypothetical protein n=1 Tax=Marinithermofilum abyssi TaxID=1571185 RepID=UPI0016682EEF|nr:hypothetical protein [Marinithermofilum abyssi]